MNDKKDIIDSGMNYGTKFLLAILVLTASVSVKAQKLEVVATSGDFYENSSLSLSWTLGEVAVETLVGDNIILTQGFQQSKLTVTAIDELQSPGIELTVYPNPTNRFLFIEVIGLNYSTETY